MDVRPFFEAELQQRGLTFSIHAESGRHAVEIGDEKILISLENLQRDVDGDGDTGRIARFVDAIAASPSSEATLSLDQIYWSLESNDYEERADFRVEVSNRVDRVLVHLSKDGLLVTWITPAMLGSLGISEADAAARAFANLAGALSEATFETQDIDGARLAFVATRLPFKASLILAPNLREIVEPLLGWPLMAVAPDRDFLYLWGARQTEFIKRVGAVVVREYLSASYPISTEVYEISDLVIRAIGEFPTGT